MIQINTRIIRIKSFEQYGLFGCNSYIRVALVQYTTTGSLLEDYFLAFALEVFEVEGFCLGRRLDRRLFILAALFLWINLFLAARSAREIAFLTFSLVAFFLLRRTAISSCAKVFLFTACFLKEARSALLAVLVTGINSYLVSLLLGYFAFLEVFIF
ncbi:MAG: hypothetical protein UT40_C0005G0048 [Candidatus Woesebacteria bacterium GW2011_GWA1_39_21b]|nr:MAG: hypothetical protein US72_C0001G0030 [Microgenomates group bacterium GW2011_GWC1_38_12]KKR14119.1 MAG: hypothetical protein UT40_C0005G0048 [Candidatus Woesebacteria bacterium GW2011_GWA1_39_21b]